MHFQFLNFKKFMIWPLCINFLERLGSVHVYVQINNDTMLNFEDFVRFLKKCYIFKSLFVNDTANKDITH